MSVEIPSACTIGEKHLPVIAEAFHRAHEKLYTYSTPESPLEIMNLRITAVGAVDKTGLYEKPMRARRTPRRRSRGSAGRTSRSWAAWPRCPCTTGTCIEPGHRITGPAIIEERITTIVVHPGWDARVDGFENVVMEART